MPVPKKPRPTEPNHYRPIALTSIIIKCLERLLLKIILPLQHLDSPGNFARILFIDFSSAFDSLQKHLLIQKLHLFNIPPHLIHLTHNFLTDRLQAVRVGSTTSPVLTINTGVPQGCVLSPFLFILYTNDCPSISPTTSYLKYSDDTANLALLSDNQSTLDYLDTCHPLHQLVHRQPSTNQCQ